MTKLFIATPAFNGLVSSFYAVSMAETYQTLIANGIHTTICVRDAGSLLVAERNAILMDFLKGDYTHLLCIDADIGWSPQAVLQLLSYEKDFVGACYPARGSTLFFLRPEVAPDGGLIETAEGLIKMHTIPAGFMLLSRNCVETMCKKYDSLYYKPKSTGPSEADGYMLFSTELIDGEFWGEDYVFCLRARQAGFSLLADPRIELNHAGRKASLQSVIDSEGTKISKETADAT